MNAHFNLSIMYRKGNGVEKDEKKAAHHLEEAAIGGHHVARFNLGVHEWNSGRHVRAMRHYIIAAKLGHDDALEAVTHGFQTKDVNKEDFEAALRGHQAAVDETKSEQRAAAYEFFKMPKKRNTLRNTNLT
jgi:TPR repeat protein